ncbi:PH domain-containing protein [Shewanella halifaxensis]|uniref:PH domain-containing protein n=1 Tax=Shewanella halifaxensis TaxID=271098 RepID=UPI000D59A581|nr:PH domain-containing protein [Shewanella halifaxensis]
MVNFNLLSDERYLDMCKKVAEDSNCAIALKNKALPALKAALNNDEAILAFSFGYVDGSPMNSLIILTDSRILFLKKGFFGGLKSFEIKINTINHYKVTKGTLTSKLVIGLLNGKELSGQIDRSSSQFFDRTLLDAYEILDKKSHKTNHEHVIEKQARMENFDKSLNIIWEGVSGEVSFTYEKWNNELKKEEDSRRSIKPTAVYLSEDNEFYIRGICSSSNESRTFKQSRISTMMQVNSKRYYFGEWCSDILKINLEQLAPDTSWRI